MMKKYSLSGLFILLISLSWGQTLNFEFVESSGSCGSTTDCESNIVCFDLYAKSSGYVGDARMVSYEISFCYDEDVLTYLSDNACLIDNGNDFNAGIFGEYNVGGNSVMSGAQVISDTSFTLLHSICFTYTHDSVLENTVVIGACNSTMFIIPANTAQITDDEGPKSVGSFVEDSLTLTESTISCLEPDCGTVSVEAFLEGPYQTTTGTMSTARLYQHHLLPGMDKDKSSAFTVRQKASHTPFGHPYSGSPWNYTDYLGKQFGESSSPGAPAGVQPYDADVIDWVLVTVRKDSLTPGANVWQCAAWLHRDGAVSFPDTCVCLTVDTTSDYYIMVEHRNHFGALSPQPATELNGGDTLYWDFTTSDSYRPDMARVGQKQKSDGVWTMHAANSGVVDYTSINSSDRTRWTTEQNDINYLYGDHNLNVIANSEDETIWKVNQNLATGVVFY